MPGLDEFERGTLEAVLASTEVRLAAAPGNRDPALERLAYETRQKLGFVEKKMDVSNAEEKQREREAVAARMAQEELALTARERETFSGFLKNDFFTKADFGALEQFYTQTWDRLSEKGKDAMSTRIWEGIRRDEFTFGGLPKVVRENESDRAYKRLHDSSIGDPDLGRIPASDREEFIRAYEAGKREEAEEILERDSFKANMFRSAESKAVKHASVTLEREAESEALFNEANATAGNSKKEKSPEAVPAGEVDFSSLSLGGMKVADSGPAASPPDVANVAPPLPRRR